MTTRTTLEDLDPADIALLSNLHQNMQEKTDVMATTAENLGLNVSTKKTKSMQMNAGVKNNI
jgi:hypothetical protein